jgi:hypothetical protein
MATYDPNQAFLVLSRGPVGPEGDVIPQLSMFDPERDYVRELERACIELAVDVARHRGYLDNNAVSELFSELGCFRVRLAYLCRKAEALRRGVTLNAKPTIAETTKRKVQEDQRAAANGRYGGAVMARPARRRTNA